jgi:flagellar basal-body rod protein FlgC
MAIENNIGPMDIAISGLRAQNRQMEIISNNIANARSANTGNGEPYRRLEATFRAGEGMSGVELDEIVPDMSDFEKMLEPGNPSADENGYVSMPNVNLPVEMMNLSTATRMYQANTAVMKRYQQMVETTLELLR